MMQPIKVLIVDDEQACREDLRYRLSPYDAIQIVAESETAEQAITHLSEQQIDVAFLDIEMHGIDGITLAEIITKEYPSTNIVFVTAYPQYSLKSHDYHPIHYLTKPISDKKLMQAIIRLQRTIDHLISNAGKLVIHFAGIMNSLYIVDIAAIYRKNRQSHILKTDGTELVSNASLQYFLEQLKAYPFQRIHNSVIANLSQEFSISACGDGTFSFQFPRLNQSFPISANEAKILRRQQ
ncbi:MAG: LytTR family DNA-binding domain-containing protein [Gammaproteobacteria bacterium]|nr:LytTR family DNA-binding domain-containing protein [Gammaproteobacteria bacterium]MDH5729267.1 LytTR family DNA-binding domain-containing protein [Gammaproteobacteria bacterium]